ncbi:uncharacterized protein ACOB8E_000569 [Sarcophilus harrisii]
MSQFSKDLKARKSYKNLVDKWSPSKYQHKSKDYKSRARRNYRHYRIQPSDFPDEKLMRPEKFNIYLLNVAQVPNNKGEMYSCRQVQGIKQTLFPLHVWLCAALGSGFSSLHTADKRLAEPPTDMLPTPLLVTGVAFK